MAYIFDLDLTIVDSSIAEKARRERDWKSVYRLIPYFKLYDGMDRVFRILHNKGEKICVVTSSPRTYCERVLQQFNLCADLIVSYHDTRMHKPHPEPIQRAIELMGVSPDEVISIGDADNDMIASAAAGVQSCLACWGRKEDSINISVDYIFHTTEELLEYITR